jgi:hypothetical protein
METDGKVKSIWKKLIESDSQESSKRFLAIYIVLIIGTLVTFYGMLRYDVDVIQLLAVWLGFAGALLGISSWQSNRKDKYNCAKEQEEIRSNAKTLREDID